MDGRFPALRQPISIGPTVVPNRIVRTAAGTGLAGERITADFIAYHVARARGGVGLLVLGDTRIHPTTGGAIPMWSDEPIAGYRALTSAVHAAGKVVFQMLSHHGAAAAQEGPPWSASAVADISTGAMPVEMTPSMIAEIVEAFAAAARRCRAGGMDGIEIHAGHGFLVSQFLSPLTNHRTDGYGGSRPNRWRFLREVLSAVRAAVAEEIPVGVRVSAAEGLPGGIEVDETIALVQALEQAGLADFVDVSLGHLGSYPVIIGGLHEPRRYQLGTTCLVTAATRLPTIVAGRIDSLRLAEEVVASGVADLVSIMRPTIADPELVNKSFAGRAAEVRPCIACNECFHAVTADKRLACAVNPQAVPPYRARRRTGRRRVVVVGGGPAGLEAARTAASDGHEVILVEARPALGGAVRTAARAPYRAGIGLIVDWYERELRRLRADVRLGSPADADLIERLAAEQVVLATGARPSRNGVQAARPDHWPEGRRLPHVHTAAEIHDGAGQAARRPVVVDDLGTYEAVGVAEQLAAAGAAVTIVTAAAAPAEQLRTRLEREPAIRRLKAVGVRFLTGQLLQSIGPTAVTLYSPACGSERSEPADLIVLITGYEPVDDLAGQLTARRIPVTVVGDARAPGRISQAIRSGFEAAVAPEEDEPQ